MGWEKKRSSHSTARHASCSLACLIGSARLGWLLLSQSPSSFPHPHPLTLLPAIAAAKKQPPARPPGPSSLVRTAAEPLPSRSAPFPSLPYGCIKQLWNRNRNCRVV
ncbi:hypothetical protein PVAP13_1KG548001 [Panicum virgatum]|uniref:Uncharacterized protein n=1 Tax=Panicum virgatum TaxID=38727 RepID=A0A8T0XSC8_PANVG|nr:hypothetical protein PVAP13_1KG548001 [Panicum virgatum]